MEWCLPGTVLTADPAHPEAAEAMFSSLFLSGGLVLSQVARVTGLEPYTIQNWVKRGFLAPPQNKKYTRRQLSRLIIINMLKSAIPMEQICQLLSYVNGHLDDESDDTIDDSRLYGYFLVLAARVQSGRLSSPEEREQLLPELLQDYMEPFPGARERIASVLRIMLVAWLSSSLQHEAAELLADLHLTSETK